MGIAETFQQFCNNIRISQYDVSNISERYKKITRRLNIDFWDIDNDTKHSLYVGSYGRDTDIVTSDIDMVMVLPYSTYVQYNNHYGNGQSALLQKVKKSISETYPRTDLKGDGQVVVVEFSDGVIFEVVPCFDNTDSSFTFPDSNNGGSWKTTNPKPEIKAIADGDRAWNSNLKRLCKMARSWKYKWNVPMGGLLIDTFAYRFMENWEHRNKSYLYYDYMTRDFFKYLSEISTEQEYWLAIGSRQYIYKKGAFQYKAKQCYNKCLDAIKDFNNGYEYTARSTWREVFGSDFPS
jgi:Second Messenger Oligonucleotide or Dinucleotide Synthetase domain